jgi:hypothetical protein
MELKYWGILTFCEKYQLEIEVQTIFLICLPFAHRANGSLSFVRLLTKKQMEAICLQLD